MAMAFASFAADALGSQPAGWTEAQDATLAKATVVAAAWGLSGRAARLEPRPWVGDSSSIIYTLLNTTWGVIPGACEVAGRMKVHVYDFSGQTFGLLRAQNALDSSSYQAAIISNGTRQLNRNTSRVARTTLASGAGGLVVDGIYGWRFSINDLNELTYRIWTWNDLAADFGESTASTYTATDGAPLAAGYVGLGFRGSTPNAAGTANPYHWIEYDRVGLGTNGDPAPLVPPTAYTRTCATAISGIEASSARAWAMLRIAASQVQSVAVAAARAADLVRSSASVIAGIGVLTSRLWARAWERCGPDVDTGWEGCGTVEAVDWEEGAPGASAVWTRHPT